MRRLKAEADHDLTADGPDFAAQAIAAGPVDEYHLFLTRSVVAGGKRVFPDGAHLVSCRPRSVPSLVDCSTRATGPAEPHRLRLPHQL
ncbi:hypothetical protein [Streptomyces sp. NPDC048392]|uniref:hypothetical protein n=1 Tax=Streptomyces sp. NPDC048392 TaxID=3365543 RepID=UPI00371183E7